MLASIMTARGVCLFWQHTDLFLIVGILVNGYKSPDPSISSMIDGGGIMSMVRVALIITISSSYSGIFEGTGLLNGLKSKMGSVSRKIMENSVIVTAPLIPWSIAGAVPLASVSAPLVSIGAAVFLYLLPIWHLIVRARKAV